MALPSKFYFSFDDSRVPQTAFSDFDLYFYNDESSVTVTDWLIDDLIGLSHGFCNLMAFGRQITVLNLNNQPLEEIMGPQRSSCIKEIHS